MKKHLQEGKLDLSPGSAFRVINQLTDGLPAISADVYGEYGVLLIQSRFWNPFTHDIANRILRNPYHPLRGVYLSNLDHEHSSRDLICIQGKKSPDHRTLVTENDIRFLISFENGIRSLGLPLEYRGYRKILIDLLKKVPITEKKSRSPKKVNEFGRKSVLTVFAGMGCPFSICAGMTGAKTVSIDISYKAISLGKENIKENNLAIDDHDFRKGNPLKNLSALDSERREFSVVILDPPPVSRWIDDNTGHKYTFSSHDQYRLLVKLAAPLVAPGGFLMAFTNINADHKTKWLADVERGIEDAKKERPKIFEQRNFLSTRRKLRINKGLSPKERKKTLASMDFSVSPQLIERMYNFERYSNLTPESKLEIDFSVPEDDPDAQTFFGVIFRRKYGNVLVKPEIKEKDDSVSDQIQSVQK